MRNTARVAVLIPAVDEEQAIAKVISAIPHWVDTVMVVDNGSTDATSRIALAKGAQVTYEPRRGYGFACLAGIISLQPTDIVVFLDGDFSDYPEEMDRLVDPIIAGRADLVIGSRVRGTRARGALKPQARFGNLLACLLMRIFWGVKYTDLGPFRAIHYRALRLLDMQDTNYGWTVEMQIRAACKRLRSLEVPVSYRVRIGRSKVTGTMKGVLLAGSKILYTIFKSALQTIR